jgi:hypothetical protein
VTGPELVGGRLRNGRGEAGAGERICLLAGFNPTGRIRTWVVDYVRELARHATVFYLSDGPLDSGELDRLRPFCEEAWVSNHGKYDFGSWSELACERVGWERLARCRELVLANDSCFCLGPFDPVFEKMNGWDGDAWALLATDEDNKERSFSLEDYLGLPSEKVPSFCLGSYFLALRSTVVREPGFRAFLEGVERQPDRRTVCERYEYGLTRWLKSRGFRCSAFVEVVHRNATVYDEQAFRLLSRGFPLLKARIFASNPLGLENLEDWVDFACRVVGHERLRAYLEELGGDGRRLPLRTAVRLGRSFERAWSPPAFGSGLRGAVWLLAPPVLFDWLRRLRRGFRRFRHSRKEPVRSPSREAIADELRRAGGSKRLVVFFNLAHDSIGGGRLSIDRFVAASRELGRELGFEVLVSGVPLDNRVVDYSLFRASAPMVPFAQVVRQLDADDLTLFLPECSVQVFLDQLDPEGRRWLKRRTRLRVNILDQNHRLLAGRRVVERLRDLTDDVTLTAAHPGYATEATASEYDCPVSRLTPFLPELDPRSNGEKSDLVIVSPDPGPDDGGRTKAAILDAIRRELPGYRATMPRRTKLDDYFALMREARFAISFGEGFDGYFVETFLSGGIAFAVANETFFPEEFRNGPTVFPSWGELERRIVSEIRILERDSKRYGEVRDAAVRLIRGRYGREKSMSDLRDFYERRFLFLPKVHRADPKRLPGGYGGEQARWSPRADAGGDGRGGAGIGS